MLNCIRPLIEVSKMFLIQRREFEKHKMAEVLSFLYSQAPFSYP